jgi:hypothetical protein
MKQAAHSAFCVVHAGFLSGLFFDPEDWGDMFLQNISWYSWDYMESYAKRYLFIVTTVRT